MTPNKTFLQEIALDSAATKEARSQPLQQENFRKMDFFRSLINSHQNLTEEEVSDTSGPKDHVAFDVPLLMRVFELVREGVKSDVEQHQVIERILELRNKGVLTMDDYAAIAGGNPNGTEQPAPEMPQESLDLLKHLAGIVK